MPKMDSQTKAFHIYIYQLVLSHSYLLLPGITDDQEGRRMVQISFKQLDDLKTKLINAIEVKLASIT